MSQRVIESLSRGLVAAEGRNRNRNRNRNQKKNKNRKGRKKIFSLCQSQRPACEALIQDSCAGNAGCVAAGLQCCDQVEICEFTAFVACASAISA
jgi:hypothetical protein